MTDKERLEQIAARARLAATAGPNRDIDGRSFSGRHIADVSWLLFRIRELEAQAERDAKVVRHAAEYVALNTEMDDLNKADIDYIERFDELWLRADKAWESLCAELAAREEGE